MGVSENERTLVLPNDDKIRILAISLAKEDPGVKSAQPIYDMLGRTAPPSPQN
jgi:alpha-mannosidase